LAEEFRPTALILEPPADHVLSRTNKGRSALAGFSASSRALFFQPTTMIDLSDLIRPDAVLPSLKAGSKKQVLQALAEKAASIAGLPEKAILDALIQREKLGSTAVGGGVAIPHARLPGIERIFGLFAHLARPVDFESLDEQPVDIAVLMLAPEAAGADHLKALARIARVLREPGVVARLRASFDATALYAVLTEGAGAIAA
jgi:PTS system nitrogen regulatory IIA component